MHRTHWSPPTAAIALVLAVALSGCGRSAGEPATEATSPSPVAATVEVPTSSAAVPGATTTTDGDTETDPTSTSLAPLARLDVRVVESEAAFPVMVAAPVEDARIFLVGKEGTIWVQPRLGGEETLVLDLRSRVSTRSEQGLLGLAFPPDFEQRPRAFVDYTDPDGATVVSEFAVAEDGTFLDEQVLLIVPQPAANHNGGHLAFGPDGALYVSLGDGGAANDEFGHGRDPGTLLGTLLRLDVSEPGRAVPAAGNPFEDTGGAPEVWAFGLRNPWRFAFDDGWLMIADVGQGSYEEINRVQADQAGADYGWSTMEGLHCFSPAVGCDPTGLVLPVLEISHGDAGTCSVTGGFTYRGAEIPEIDGQYFYSDYCGGYLRSAQFADGEVVEHLDWSEQVGDLGQVTSFGVDGFGELYITSSDGTVRRLVADRAG